MFHIYDINLDIHHFYRHESSLEKRIKDKITVLSEKQAKFNGKEHRIRWINYFHLSDSIEMRLQSVLTLAELEDVCKCIFPYMKEVLSFTVKEEVVKLSNVKVKSSNEL